MYKISEINCNFVIEILISGDFTMKTALITILLLVISNVFMTFAWYGHLKLSASGISKTQCRIYALLQPWFLLFYLLNNHDRV